MRSLIPQRVSIEPTLIDERSGGGKRGLFCFFP
jgi:hypothetical protein